MRPTNEHERRDLKAVTGRALREVGAANFAPDCRVSESNLSKYASLGEADKFMPIDVVADLERVIGDPVITSVLAGLSGFRLVPDEAAPTRPSMADAGALAGTKGKLLAMLIDALLDGHVDPHEQRALLPVVRDAIVQMQAMERGLMAVSHERG